MHFGVVLSDFFAQILGKSVGSYRLRRRVAFDPLWRGIAPDDGQAAGVDHPLQPMTPGGFKEVIGAFNVLYPSAGC